MHYIFVQGFILQRCIKFVIEAGKFVTIENKNKTNEIDLHSKGQYGCQIHNKFMQTLC